MTLLTDAEQNRLNDELESDHWQRVAPDLIKAIQQSTEELKITTGRLSPHVVNALRKAGYIKKIEEHDQKLQEHDGFIASIRRAFGGIVKSPKQ